MKKLNLEQMETVNGGCRCERLMRRFSRMQRRGNSKGMDRMIAKIMRSECCG